MHVNPASAWAMLIFLYQSAAGTGEMYEIHESYLFSDIHESTTRWKRTELCIFTSKFLIDVKALFCETTHFSRTISMPDLRLYRIWERTDSFANNVGFQKRRWNSSQVWTAEHESISPVWQNSRLVENRARSDTTVRMESTFHKRKGWNRKTYTLSLFRDVLEFKGLLVHITAKPGIAQSLYYGGRTLHSLLGIGVENKDNWNDGNSFWTSKFGP